LLIGFGQAVHLRTENAMITLCIRYTFNPNKLEALKTYIEAEQAPIRRSGGETFGYFLPTDFAGPTNEAMWLIEFPGLAAYETYRAALANDPEHKKNAAALAASGANVAMNRSIVQRAGALSKISQTLRASIQQH
jgi:hypothetical protein